MAQVVNLGLDATLPLMVFADVALVYPHDYVLTPERRMVRATESRVQYLITRAIADVRRDLQSSGKVRGYVAFRMRVIELLCAEYGFIAWPTAKRVILREEVDDVVEIIAPR